MRAVNFEWLHESHCNLIHGCIVCPQACRRPCTVWLGVAADDPRNGATAFCPNLLASSSASLGWMQLLQQHGHPRRTHMLLSYRMFDPVYFLFSFVFFCLHFSEFLELFPCLVRNADRACARSDSPRLTKSVCGPRRVDLKQFRPKTVNK